MNNKGGKVFGIIIIIIIAVLVLTMCGGSSGHAPGYGNTKKCTICGKPATHSTSNYGYCDKHWKDAINYKK